MYLYLSKICNPNIFIFAKNVSQNIFKFVFAKNGIPNIFIFLFTRNVNLNIYLFLFGPEIYTCQRLHKGFTWESELQFETEKYNKKFKICDNIILLIEYFNSRPGNGWECYINHIFGLIFIFYIYFSELKKNICQKSFSLICLGLKVVG